MSTRRLEVVITGDTRSLNRAVGSVSSDMGRMESATRKAGRAIAVGLGVGLAAAIPLAMKAGDAASDLAEQVNKTGAVFKASAPEIVEWSTSTSQSLGISQRAALEAAGTFGNMLVPMGFARDAAGEMSTRMVELAADLSSFNNASPEETLDAIRAGLAGESEPLRRFGVFLSDARLKQEALNQGLYDGKGALDANAKAQATYSLILKDTADAQGDFARTSDGVANSQRIARAELENAAATTGRVFVPVMAKVLTVVNDVLLAAQRNWPRFRQLTAEAFTAAQRVVAQAMGYYRANILPTIQAIVAGARGFWRRFGGDITNAFNLARRVAGNAMRAVAAVITGVLAVIRGDWSTAWNSLKTVVQSAVNAVLAILRGLPGIVFGIATGIGKAIADGVMAGLGNLASRIASAVRGGLGAADNTPSIDLGNGGLTGRGRQSDDAVPGSKSEDARGSSPSSPNFALARVPAGSSTDLSRVRGRGDRNADAARRRGEAAARRSGASEEDVAQAGERAWIKARTANLKNIRTRINARRKRLIRDVKKFDINARRKVKVPGPKYPEKRQKAIDRRASMKQTEEGIRGELETLAADYADAAAQLADLGEQSAALDRTDEAEAAAAAEEAADAAATAAAEAPTERDFLEAAAAEATLTAGTEDDIAAAGGLVGLAERELAAARASGDPRRISAAIQTLRQAQENLEALTANTEAVAANTEAITQAFGGSTVFGYRGQDYGLRSLSAPSSDRLVGAEVGL